MILAFTYAESMTVKYNLNPFQFLHFDCNFVAIRMAGLQLPSKSFRPDFQNKLVQRELRAVYDDIGVLTENHGCLLNIDDYCDGATVFCFYLCHDRSNGGQHDHKIRKGNIDLEINFAKPLPEAISVLCYFSYDTIVSITKERNVIMN